MGATSLRRIDGLRRLDRRRFSPRNGDQAASSGISHPPLVHFCRQLLILPRPPGVPQGYDRHSASNPHSFSLNAVFLSRFPSRPVSSDGSATSFTSCYRSVKSLNLPLIPVGRTRPSRTSYSHSLAPRPSIKVTHHRQNERISR